MERQTSVTPSNTALERFFRLLLPGRRAPGLRGETNAHTARKCSQFRTHHSNQYLCQKTEQNGIDEKINVKIKRINSFIRQDSSLHFQFNYLESLFCREPWLEHCLGRAAHTLVWAAKVEGDAAPRATKARSRGSHATHVTGRDERERRGEGWEWRHSPHT